MRVPPPGASEGSGYAPAPPEVFFDPNAFPTAVFGVTRARDGMETIAKLVPPPPPPDPSAFVTTSAAWHPPMSVSVDPGAFGAVSAAWLAFHTAWSAEVATALSALEEMVGILPVTGEAYLHADHENSTRIMKNSP
jgi:hypothetical protein